MNMAAPMTPEQRLARFVVQQPAAAVPAEARATVRHIVRAVAGTALAGAGEDGIAALRQLLLERGGAPQATLLVFGDRLPAAAAAQFNATLCRALDFCDAMAPGPHLGAAVIPAALAAAELAGIDGRVTTGEDFVAALGVGAELVARFNLDESQYDGFDPTGICVVFGTTAAVARLLGLDEAQTLHALALAFNRCGGSFQSHVDGSLGVRITQGWVAQAAVECAQMARLGITGPHNFLAGSCGYGHLYGRGRLDTSALVAGLGEAWHLQRVVFKQFPSCGVTQGVTALVLRLVAAHGLRAGDVASAEVRLPPYAHRLVGQPFKLGGNPRVDAQFSAAWCVANALQRGRPQLAHFEPAQVAAADLLPLVQRIAVVADPALDARGHTAVDLAITTHDGRLLRDGLDTAPGFPGAALSEDQHRARFDDCLAYAAAAAPKALAPDQAAALRAALDDLAGLPDARLLAPLLVP